MAPLPRPGTADDNDPVAILAGLPADDEVTFNESELGDLEKLLGNIINVCYLRCGLLVETSTSVHVIFSTSAWPPL